MDGDDYCVRVGACILQNNNSPINLSMFTTVSDSGIIDAKHNIIS